MPVNDPTPAARRGEKITKKKMLELKKRFKGTLTEKQRQQFLAASIVRIAEAARVLADPEHPNQQFETKEHEDEYRDNGPTPNQDMDDQRGPDAVATVTIGVPVVARDIEPKFMGRHPSEGPLHPKPGDDNYQWGDVEGLEEEMRNHGFNLAAIGPKWNVAINREDIHTLKKGLDWAKREVKDAETTFKKLAKAWR